MKKKGAFLLTLILVLNLFTGIVFADTASTPADKLFDILYSKALSGSYNGTFGMKTDEPLEFVDKIVEIQEKAKDGEAELFDMYNPMDYKLFADSLATINGTIIADYNISQNYDKIQMYAKMTFDKPVVLNENLSLEANMGYEMYMDFDFSDIKNPLYKLIMKTPMSPKYIYIDYSELLKQTSAQISGLAISDEAMFSAFMGYIEGTVDTIKASMKNNSTVTFSNNAYTMTIDDKGLKNIIFDVADSITSSTDFLKLLGTDTTNSLSVEDLKSGIESFKKIANKITILGSDGYKTVYKIDNSGNPVAVEESVDISINIFDILNAVGSSIPEKYSSIAREDWNVDITSTSNMTYSNVGSNVVINYPTITDQNSFDFSKLMEKEMNSESVYNDFERTFFYADYNGEKVERNGEIYIPARAFAASCNIDDDEIFYNADSDMVTLIGSSNYGALPFETLSFYTNGHSFVVNGQDFWIDTPTFEENGVTYIPISAFSIININFTEITTTYSYFKGSNETYINTTFCGELIK